MSELKELLEQAISNRETDIEVLTKLKKEIIKNKSIELAKKNNTIIVLQPEMNGLNLELESEIINNPRARSAHMRGVEKV